MQKGKIKQTNGLNIVLPLTREEEQRRFLRFREVMSKTEAGRYTLGFLEYMQMPVHFGYVENDAPGVGGAGAMYLASKDEKYILVMIDKEYGDIFEDKRADGILASYIAHEVHHAFQDTLGLVRSAGHLKPGNDVMKMRFTEAAAYAWQVHFSHQLHTEGVDLEPWKNCLLQYPNISKAYDEAIKAEKTDREALRAAFEAFFESGRTRDFYDDMALSQQALAMQDIEKNLRLHFIQTGQELTTAEAVNYPLYKARPVTEAQLEKYGQMMDEKGNFLTDCPGKSVKDLATKSGMSSRNVQKMRALEEKYYSKKTAPSQRPARQRTQRP